MSAATLPAGSVVRGSRSAVVLGVLAAVLVGLGVWSAGSGAYAIPPLAVVGGVLAKLGVQTAWAPDDRALGVLWAIRLPRVGLSVVVGGGLAAAGVLLQALLRNPLASPQVLGVSTGASFGAAVAIVLGAAGPLAWSPSMGVPALAFAGALGATALVLGVAGRHGRRDTATLLLAGIAVNALCGAGTGLLTFVADDAQLRTLTFWTFGSLGGASAASLGWVTVWTLGIVSLAAWLAPTLDLLQLGEEDASLLGVHVRRVALLVVVACALLVGAVVSVAGIIGFVGLVVPHIARLLLGPSHRALTAGAVLIGAATVTGGDLLCRTVVAPAELPIGILTTLLAAPFFVWLLVQARRRLA